VAVVGFNSEKYGEEIGAYIVVKKDDCLNDLK